MKKEEKVGENGGDADGGARDIGGDDANGDAAGAPHGNDQQDDDQLNTSKLKEQEETCNALVQGMLPYEIELLEHGHESYEKIRNDLIQLIDAQDQSSSQNKKT